MVRREVRWQPVVPTYVCCSVMASSKCLARYNTGAVTSSSSGHVPKSSRKGRVPAGVSVVPIGGESEHDTLDAYQAFAKVRPTSTLQSHERLAGHGG